MEDLRVVCVGCRPRDRTMEDVRVVCVGCRPRDRTMEDLRVVCVGCRPRDRTMEDLEIVYEELLHIKALSHLSTMLKRELATVLMFESHSKAGTIRESRFLS